MAKWFRVPHSRFDRLPDLDAALEAARAEAEVESAVKDER